MSVRVVLEVNRVIETYCKASQFAANGQNASVWVGEFSLQGVLESSSQVLAVGVAQQTVGEQDTADSNEAMKIRSQSAMYSLLLI